MLDCWGRAEEVEVAVLWRPEARIVNLSDSKFDQQLHVLKASCAFLSVAICEAMLKTN